MRVWASSLIGRLIGYCVLLSIVTVSLLTALAYTQASPGVALAVALIGVLSGALLVVGVNLLARQIGSQLFETARALQRAKDAQAKLHVAEHFYESLAQNSPVA